MGKREGMGRPLGFGWRDMQVSNMNPLIKQLEKRKQNKHLGVYSACTANETAIKAVMERAGETGTLALIEATANQVNQYGGYTGLRPKDFVAYIQKIARDVGFDTNSLILGGDHLGPVLWQNEPEEDAMAKAEVLVREYVQEGFTKIHIDTSMRLACDDSAAPLSDEVIARRAAKLCKVADDAYTASGLDNSDQANKMRYAPVYVIGSEVPIPGGATDNEEEISVTTPTQFKNTMDFFLEEFNKAGLAEVFSRVIGVVVQPGVEFSDLTITEYDRSKAAGLCKALDNYPGMVFEGHSTDYQTREKLKEMVVDGIVVLKVGPALTYAFRQALFALQDIETELFAKKGIPFSDFRNVLDSAMLSNPVYWKKYYHGNEQEIAFKRKYSLSDRCRYYLPDADVLQSINRLIHNIDSVDMPLALLEQYMPLEYKKHRSGEIDKKAGSLLKEHIKGYIDDYIYAIK